MIKKPFLIVTFLFLPFVLLSCSQNNISTHDSAISNLRMSGNLQHTQYWNKNDNWDFNGLSVCVDYSDGTSIEYSLSSSNVSFEYEPAKPSDGVNSVVLKDVYFVDFYGNKNLVVSRIDFQVTVIDYPYDYAKVNFSNLIIPAAICLISGTIVIAGIIVFNFKKKKGMF